MRRKRVFAPQSGSISDKYSSPTVPSDGTFLPSLSHITEGCVVREVNPAACIPLYLSRARSENAIRKLKALITGANSEHSGDTLLLGIVSASPTSVVVPLIGRLDPYVDLHLVKNYTEEADRAKIKESHEVWFGVIDGCQLACALQDLQESFPLKFGGFMWKVIAVRHGLDMSEYQKLSIVQNERNKQVYHYESTLFDICLLYTSPSPRDQRGSRMPSSA